MKKRHPGGSAVLVLAATLGPVFCAAAGEAAGARQTRPPFRIETLADGVLAAVVDDRVPSYAFANSLVVIGEDGVLVVDTQQSPAAARALLDEIRRRTDRPVRWVVNTHWHGDHVFGNRVYAEAFPGVELLAHPSTRDSVAAAGPRQIEEQRQHERRRIGLLDSALAAATDGAEREKLGAAREGRAAYLSELDSLRVLPPDGAVRDRLTVDVGGRSVELIHFGPAHTAGDVVVWLHDVRIAAVGDLVEEGGLWLEGADREGWRHALERLRSLGPRLLVPGHGPVADAGALERALAQLE